MSSQAVSTQTLPLTIGADLSAAVLKTLAYSDIFDFPLSATEIHRYLIGSAATQSEIELALAGLGEHVIRQDGFFALHGHELIFELRRKREAHAAKLWPQASRFGALIAALPFVRMVALTGALAASNAEYDADLDYLIVTKPGRLWLCRAAILGLNRTSKLFGLRAELCPNYLITSEHLAVEDRDLFTAEELVRMIPLSGAAVYAQMRFANKWTDAYLPNAADAPRLVASANKPISWFKRVVEAVFRVLPLGWLEGWEMRRKIAKFARQGMNAETRFSADYCKGHFDGHKGQTLRAYEERLRKLGLA